ncbi:catalase family protein [Methylomonas sp. MK1]|uniref:catalase family protein n=1 Tax=Methylomonas sp. MK1 TaxID=1131552 RepID=UPI00037CC81F|nr:catalase family protein [Methylomonas sp. MK1]
MSEKQLAEEIIPPNESQVIEDLTAQLKAKIIQDNPTGIMRRDAHPKMHGLVKAEFIVEADLPEELKIGLFKEPKTYQAWIRFSNASGTINPDHDNDIRGMAIKLMGVPGEKLLDAEKHAQTHDLLLISASRFVTKDVEEFDALVKALTGSVLAKIVFFLSHWRVVFNLLRSMHKFANPLQIRYFSATPYLLGSRAVKYSAIPHVAAPDSIPSKPAADYLRLAMVRQLQSGDAVFDFAVQLQTDPEAMPIEDPGVEWLETLSPFRKVATIRIFQQAFDTEAQNTFGEHLSFTPWHALPEHRPLGGVNRARRVVYNAISAFRHERNNVPRTEPNSWDI